MKNSLCLLFLISLLCSCGDAMDDIELKHTDEIQSENIPHDEYTNSIVDDLNGLIR
ncbi:hypothetical protein SAMN04488029_1409 [Reichenbachiella faecimaris]|uniref:Uncharacterized protein n=1 Tax=Reichenbachiella faecimaris TaxID=692418 RepID=A0A1W2G9R3_REIFA|nr:hypothetical protein [Reichenbachiella faecimaris]SMD33046.1 hypothetical protein SAMN04488029_1409 [Reichenbachiella faecimaris]